MEIPRISSRSVDTGALAMDVAFWFTGSLATLIGFVYLFRRTATA